METDAARRAILDLIVEIAADKDSGAVGRAAATRSRAESIADLARAYAALFTAPFPAK